VINTLIASKGIIAPRDFAHAVSITYLRAPTTGKLGEGGLAKSAIDAAS
jgi:hypothetical protein